MIVSRERTEIFEDGTAPGFPEGICAFNLVADGFYWRTSNIIQCDITFPENDGFTKITYSPESDNVTDEYEVLAETISSLKNFSRIITFNGNSFAFPYLRNKSKAYEICYNTDGISTYDLYILFKPLYHLLGLPSRKLKDYLNFLEYKGNADSSGIIKAVSLAPYLEFLDGKYSAESVRLTDDDVVFSFVLDTPVPKRISYAMAPFYLILNGEYGNLSSKIFDGSLRVYHSDYKNYDFLVNEGYAVHKSISGFMDKAKKESAVRENAYTYMKITDSLFSHDKTQYDYISQTVRYLSQFL